MPEAPPLLEQLLPDHDFGERHRRVIAAPPERVVDAIRSFSAADMPIARLMMSVRGLSRSAGSTDRPFLDGMSDLGFAEIAEPKAPRGSPAGPGEEPAKQLVFGGIGQPWRARGGRSIRVEGADSFTGFDHPGFVKMAMDFRLYDGAGGTRLETNTWVQATDSHSRRRFRLYWFAIRPGSGIIRRNMLSAIAHLAEAADQPAGKNGKTAAKAGG
jgi:hypothetical protein